MRYKHFKNADVSVSALAVGTWAIGGQNYGQVDRSDSVRAIRTMIDQGVNLVDTAPCYGNGASEKIVFFSFSSLILIQPQDCLLKNHPEYSDPQWLSFESDNWLLLFSPV